MLIQINDMCIVMIGLTIIISVLIKTAGKIVEKLCELDAKENTAKKIIVNDGK